MRQWAKPELKCSNSTSLPCKTESFIFLMDGSSWELLCNPTAIPQKKNPTQTILLACQINKGNCWLLQFEKPKEMDYSVFKICIEEGGRVDSHPRQADLVPPAGILNQSQSITARAAQIHKHWNSGGHCPQEALPVLELWLIQALHFLSLQPLPQVLGIL